MQCVMHAFSVIVQMQEATRLRAGLPAPLLYRNKHAAEESCLPL